MSFPQQREAERTCEACGPWDGEWDLKYRLLIIAPFALFAAACADDFQSTGYSGVRRCTFPSPIRGRCIRSCRARSRHQIKKNFCGLQFNPAVLRRCQAEEYQAVDGSLHPYEFSTGGIPFSVAGSAGACLAAGLSFSKHSHQQHRRPRPRGKSHTELQRPGPSSRPPSRAGWMRIWLG